MFGPTTTAGKIDNYESRFTVVNGAHFLIAPNRKEAWPIRAAEAGEYKALYRRRMEWARWLRRGMILAPILILILNATIPFPKTEFVRSTLGLGTALLLVFGIPLSFLLHTIISDLARVGIERQLKRRMTTRMPDAIRPALTPLGRFARRLLFTCVALEFGMAVLHRALGMDSLAEHMRVMTGLRDGQEGLLAQMTGYLTWGVHFGMILAFLLLVIDRRAKRLAAELAKQEEAAAARDDVRERMLKRLAAEAASPAP
jgi:hypothetical protein